MSHSRFLKNVLDKLRQPSNGIQIDSSWISTDIGLLSGSIVNPNGVNVVDFSVPAGVHRLTLLFRGMIVRPGDLIRFGTSAGLLTDGYYSLNHFIGPYSAGVDGYNTDGIRAPKCSDTNLSFGITFYRTTPNSWSGSSHTIDGTSYAQLVTSSVELPGELTTVRFLSVFPMTSGSLQLLWEF